MEAGFRLPHSLFSRNDYVPTENHLWRQAFCSSAGNSDHPGSHPLFGTQPHDPSGDARKLSRCVILAPRWTDCACFSIYAPKPCCITTLVKGLTQSQRPDGG